MRLKTQLVAQLTIVEDLVEPEPSHRNVDICHSAGSSSCPKQTQAAFYSGDMSSLLFCIAFESHFLSLMTSILEVCFWPTAARSIADANGRLRCAAVIRGASPIVA